MKLLAIEAADGSPSLCLWRDAAASLLWRGEPRCGPEPILDAARDLLARAGFRFDDLDAVACGRGPGAFTGLRLGIALAQGIALGAGCPVVPVSELAALAWRTHREHGWTRVLTCLDARRGEVYWAAYSCERGRPRLIGDEAIAKPDRLVLPPGRWACAGSGAPLIVAEGVIERDSGLSPDAGAIAAVAVAMVADGESLAAIEVAPVYLRHRVAVPKP